MVAYLALGSNLGDRQAAIAQAVREVAKVGQVQAVSALYATDPEGGVDQPEYLNAVVRVETSLSSQALLQACLTIERDLGRVRPSGVAKAPRTMDIDLILYGDAVIEEPGLCVPHPALLARPFVRIPLAEVAVPGLRHPVTGESLAAHPPDRTVRRLD